MNRLAATERKSVLLIRAIGYFLILVGAIDILSILIPPGFTNPLWEFQMVGQLVEHIPVPLIGVALVYYQNFKFRFKLEKQLLKALSWICLGYGLLLLFLLPLGIGSAWRVNQINEAQLENQLSQRLSQLQQIENRLDQSQSVGELKQLLVPQNPASLPALTLQQVKTQLLAEVTLNQRKLRAEFAAARENQRRSLLKNTVKWNLGALTAGVLLIYLWRLTSWARRR